MALTRLGTNAITSVPSSAITALPAGVGGKVLQVVTNTHSTQTSTTSGSYVSTNLNASITPSSSSNKILVLISQNGVYKDGAETGNGCDIEFRRGATSLGVIAKNAGGEVSGSHSIGTGASTCYLDSPNTTSSITYETFFKRTGSSGAAYVQVYNCKSIITLMEIGA